MCISFGITLNTACKLSAYFRVFIFDFYALQSREHFELFHFAVLRMDIQNFDLPLSQPALLEIQRIKMSERILRILFQQIRYALVNADGS